MPCPLAIIISSLVVQPLRCRKIVKDLHVGHARTYSPSCTAARAIQVRSNTYPDERTILAQNLEVFRDANNSEFRMLGCSTPQGCPKHARSCCLYVAADMSSRTTCHTTVTGCAVRPCAHNFPPCLRTCPVFSSVTLVKEGNKGLCVCVWGGGGGHNQLHRRRALFLAEICARFFLAWDHGS